MKRLLLLTILTCALVVTVAQVQVQNLTTENLTNPIGLDIPHPRFAWLLVSPKRNVLQSAYELRVGNDPQALAHGKSNWTTGPIHITAVSIA